MQWKASIFSGEPIMSRISMMYIYVYMHISCISRSAVIVIFSILCPTTKNKKLVACDEVHAQEGTLESAEDGMSHDD